MARIVESRNPDWGKARLVMGPLGWTTYSVVDPSITQVPGPGTKISVKTSFYEHCLYRNWAVLMFLLLKIYQNRLRGQD